MPEYLEALSPGRHVLVAEFADGNDVMVQFNILDNNKAAPNAATEKNTCVTPHSFGRIIMRPE